MENVTMTFKVFMTEFMFMMILRDLESLMVCTPFSGTQTCLQGNVNCSPSAKKNRCQGLQPLTGLNKILQLVTGCFPDMF